MQKFPDTYKHPACLYEDLFRELIRANHLTTHMVDIFDARNFGFSEPQAPKTLRLIRRLTLSGRYNWTFFYHVFNL